MPADKLARKPSRLTFEQAAALAISGLAALQAVRDRGRVAPGQRVLVVGASGGVGTYAVQIAKAFGAEVTGVASTAKVELVRSLGADHVIDYRHADFADGHRRYDVIIDIGGNASLSRLRRALTPTGTLVIVGGEGGGRWLGGIDRQVRAMLLSPFVSQRLGTFISSENAADLHALKELLEAGQVTPVIDRTFPLPAAPRPSLRRRRSGPRQGRPHDLNRPRARRKSLAASDESEDGCRSEQVSPVHRDREEDSHVHRLTRIQRVRRRRRRRYS